jgi:hypothetical protein
MPTLSPYEPRSGGAFLLPAQAHRKPAQRDLDPVTRYVTKFAIMSMYRRNIVKLNLIRCHVSASHPETGFGFTLWRVAMGVHGRGRAKSGQQTAVCI